MHGYALEEELQFHQPEYIDESTKQRANLHCVV